MAVVKVNHPTWGVPPLCAAYYWKCCILPIFTYGALVWHRVCRNKTVQQKLKPIQRLALKMMGPLRRSTPTRGLEVINYIRPIELEMRKIAAEAYLRTVGQEKISAHDMKTSKITQKGHRQWCFEFLSSLNFPFLEQEFDNCTRKWTWKQRYQVDLESTLPGDQYGKPKNDAKIKLYPDGSLLVDPKNPLAAEARGGLYINEGYHIQSNKLGKNVSIFQAEMQPFYSFFNELLPQF